MMRLCPICRIVKLTRREVKTCGSAECLTQWRSFTPEQKVRVIDETATIEDPSFFLGIDKTTGTIAKRPIPVMPTKTAQRDNEFLEKIFGPDAPGVAKPEEEELPIIYGHPIKCECEMCESIRKAIK